MRKAQSELTPARLAAIMDALPEPVLAIGPGNRILTANAAAAELLGSDVTGRSVFAVIRQPEALEVLDRALRPGQGVTDPAAVGEGRFTLATPAGETTYRLVVRGLGPDAGLQAVIVSFLDISHIEEAEQMRRDFVANVSHELRSPLTALSGFIETLRGPARDDAPARERFLMIMEQEAQRMNRLVGDLLSLSRVEANEKVRPRDRIDLADVIRSTLAALRPQIEDKGVVMDFDTGAISTWPIIGDRDQLTQVFQNLIENAVKYGEAGGTVRVLLRAHASLPGFSGGVVSVDVIDQGEGIDPVHIPRLTERFYRVDTHRSREMGGTGLGLAIVKHIVNRHRGRLNIRSTRGEGSTFTVLLPLPNDDVTKTAGLS